MSNERQKLQDATAAFTFSRLPRAQRIAQTLHCIIGPGLRSYDDGPEADRVLLANDWQDLIEISEELAQYSVKDFAVRYGHLADGKN